MNAPDLKTFQTGDTLEHRDMPGVALEVQAIEGLQIAVTWQSVEHGTHHATFPLDLLKPSVALAKVEAFIVTAKQQ